MTGTPSVQPKPRAEAPEDLNDILALAVELAAQAAAVHLGELARAPNVSQKSWPHDLVTDVDREAERVIVDGLVAARPDDEILGEEGARRPGSSGVRWIIDPLDGTANYVTGYPAYAVSIGVEVEGRPSVGVVHDSARGTVYAAIRGGLALRDGQPIAASSMEDLSTALVATGFSYDPAKRGRQAEALRTILPMIGDLRRGGSAALDLCAVADGTVEGYFEADLAPWDVAGGRVIAEAAGATVTLSPLQGWDRPLVVAANPSLHASLIALLRRAGVR